MTYRVATDHLHVRNRVNGKVVDVLSQGHIIEVVALHQGKQHEWARVTYDRYGGWVVKKFLERVEDPVVPIPLSLPPKHVLGHRNWGEVALTVALFFIILFVVWGVWELS